MTMPVLLRVGFGERRNALGNVRRLLAKQMLERISVVSIIVTEILWRLTIPRKHFNFLCFLKSKIISFMS